MTVHELIEKLQELERIDGYHGKVYIQGPDGFGMEITDVSGWDNEVWITSKQI